MTDVSRDGNYILFKSRCPEKEDKVNTCLPGLGCHYTTVNVEGPCLQHLAGLL